MENLDAHQALSEVQDFTTSVRDGKGFAEITQIIQIEVQRQLEQQLIDFQAAIAQSNLAMIDVMHAELSRIKEESTTLKGVMEQQFGRMPNALLICYLLTLRYLATSPKKM
ncbi:hypothetical protein [uncultured Nostoc sp.]|uniref:hypothetical protein n=1 Tax=uncultured Nostoc sp. TaxID=340711 RepID=UPI0035CA811D